MWAIGALVRQEALRGQGSLEVIHQRGQPGGRMGWSTPEHSRAFEATDLIDIDAESWSRRHDLIRGPFSRLDLALGEDAEEAQGQMEVGRMGRPDTVGQEHSRPRGQELGRHRVWPECEEPTPSSDPRFVSRPC
jgi:hypothetical protein